MYSIRGDQKLHDLWVKSSQMPVVQFQWNTATSFYLCTIYGLFQRYGPKKTKYFLSGLLQKNSTNPFYTPLVTFNYYSVFAKHPRHNSDNLHDYYLLFTSQSAPDCYTGFCHSSINVPGSVFIHHHQQCTPRCPQDWYSLHQSLICYSLPILYIIYT